MDVRCMSAADRQTIAPLRSLAPPLLLSLLLVLMLFFFPSKVTTCPCHRFNPLDKRCGINLDEIDPAKWKLLEAATDDYIAASKDRFKQLTDILVAAPSEGM